jgi:hypothetical protein
MSVATIDAVVRCLGLGILLPVTGVLSRAVAFTIDGRVPALVATSMSIPELALLGVGLLLPGAVLGGLLALYFRQPVKIGRPRLPDRLTAYRRSLTSGMSARLRALSEQESLVFTSLITVVLSVAVVLTLPWVWGLLLEARGAGNLLSTLVTLGVMYWGFRIGRGVDLVPLHRLLPMVLVLSVSVGVASSLGPTTAGTFLAHLDFEPVRHSPRERIVSSDPTTVALGSSPARPALPWPACRRAQFRSHTSCRSGHRRRSLPSTRASKQAFG